MTGSPTRMWLGLAALLLGAACDDPPPEPTLVERARPELADDAEDAPRREAAPEPAGPSARPAETPALPPAREIAIPLEGRPQEAAYCAGQRLLAVTPAGRDRPTEVYRMDVGATSLAPVGTLPVSGYAMAFSPSCDQLAVGHSADGSNRASAYALDGSPHEIAALGPFPLPVGAIALSSDGRVAVGTNDGAVHLFDASGGPVAESAPTAGHDSVMCLLFAGDRVVVGHYHGRVRTLAVDGEALRPVESTQAATGAERERGSLDLDTGDVVMPGGRRVWALAATPRGVLALEESGTVRRLGGGASSAVVEGLSLPSVMALAPDGGHLLVAGGPAAVFALGEHGARFERAPIGFDSVEGFTAARDVFFLDDRRFAIVGFVTMRLFVYELPG